MRAGDEIAPVARDDIEGDEDDNEVEGHAEEEGEVRRLELVEHDVHVVRHPAPALVDEADAVAAGAAAGGAACGAVLAAAAAFFFALCEESVRGAVAAAAGVAAAAAAGAAAPAGAGEDDE